MSLQDSLPNVGPAIPTNPWDRPVKSLQLMPGASIYTATQGGTDKFLAAKGYSFHVDDDGVAITDAKGNIYLVPWDAILVVVPFTEKELVEQYTERVEKLKAKMAASVGLPPPSAQSDLAGLAAREAADIRSGLQKVIDAQPVNQGAAAVQQAAAKAQELLQTGPSIIDRNGQPVTPGKKPWEK